MIALGSVNVCGRMILCAEACRPGEKMLKKRVRCMGVVSAPGACMRMATAAGSVLSGCWQRSQAPEC
jgi:hypothetical protein